MASFGVPVVDVIPSPTYAASHLAAATGVPQSDSILHTLSDQHPQTASTSKRQPTPAITTPAPSAPFAAWQQSSSPHLESEHAVLDRWAFALANWVIPRWDHPIRELDGWRTVSGMRGGFVRDCSLSVFVLLGATEEMPFTVYRELDLGNEETIEPAVSWMRDLRARRLLQSALSPPPPQPISPAPVI